jgi:hypothetical protein
VVHGGGVVPTFQVAGQAAPPEAVELARGLIGPGIRSFIREHRSAIAGLDLTRVLGLSSD